MSVTLFAESLLETAETVTVQPPANAGRYLDRLYDRDRGPQYQGGAQQAWGMPLIFTLPLAMTVPTQTVIDAYLGASPAPAAGWAWVNHGITGTVRLYADATYPPTTERDSVAAVAGIDFLRTFASLTYPYWRAVIPTVTVAIGEFLLGAPRVISVGPFYRTGGAEDLGNVAHDATRAGYPYSAELGPAKTRLTYAWPALEAADAAQLMAAWADCRRGSKNVLLRDGVGTLRWVAWLNRSVKPIPLGRGRFAFEDQVFEETALEEAA